MIDIVFPYIEGEDQFCELKYAIRSIEKNFKEDFRIVLVGDCPQWIHPSSVLYISHKRHTGVFSKVEDSVNKMKFIIDHTQISDPFIYWYDDIYFLNPIDINFFKHNVFALESYKTKKENRDYNFGFLQWNTFDALKEQYPDAEILNYETHLPRLFFKDKMRTIINDYNPYENKLLLNTLYLHEFSENTILLYKNDTIKAGFYGENTNSSFGQNLSKNEIINILENKTFLNHDDGGLTPELKEIIIDKFNITSQCEQ